jgi:hypothetical protein
VTLPQWAAQLSEVSGFDPAAPWCRVICTNLEKHAPELLGVVFEDAEQGRLWGGPHIHLTRQTDPEFEVDMDDPLRLPPGPPGGVMFTCPACSRTPRLNRGDWSRLADSLDLPGEFDTSRLH